MEQIRCRGVRGRDKCLRTCSEDPALAVSLPRRGRIGQRTPRERAAAVKNSSHLRLQRARLLCESESSFKMEVPGKIVLFSISCSRLKADQSNSVEMEEKTRETASLTSDNLRSRADDFTRGLGDECESAGVNRAQGRAGRERPV